MNTRNIRYRPKKEQREAAKKAEDEFKQEWKTRIGIDKQLRKDFNDMYEEDSKQASGAYREAFKRAHEAYTADYNSHMDTEKEHRKAWNEAGGIERRKIDQAIRENRQALKDIRAAYLEERQVNADKWKALRQRDLEMRKVRFCRNAGAAFGEQRILKAQSTTFAQGGQDNGAQRKRIDKEDEQT